MAERRTSTKVLYLEPPFRGTFAYGFAAPAPAVFAYWLWTND